MIDIEKGIPFPAIRCRKYPFDKMEKGDSFFIATDKLNSVHNSASVWGRRHNMKFVVRKVDDGARVWRIK